MTPNYLTETKTTKIVHNLPDTSSEYHVPEKKIRGSKENKYPSEIQWKNVLMFITLHAGALYGGYLFITACTWATVVFGTFSSMFIAQGITAGAHRLWAHKCYKAKLPLRIILMIFQTISIQNDIHEWARDHRVHHKFTETDADPHNSRRGFFFSHIGWLMVKKHKDVMIKGKTVDMSDLEADPVVRFQRKYYKLLVPLCIPILPMMCVYICGEDPWTAFYVIFMFRFTLSLHFTWLVNSAAHMWGTKPYDRAIGPVQNLFVAVFAAGEGWHNYHHVFPWDYKTAELGGYKTNISTMFIDFFAAIGWAYDLKTVPAEIIERRVKRTGDGSRKLTMEFNSKEDNDHDHHDEDHVWGWGDADMKKEDILNAKIYT